MVAGGLLGQKEALDKEFALWIDADPERRAKYGEVLPALNALVAERAKTRDRDALLAEFSGAMGSALGAAQTLYRFSMEKPKPDADRDRHGPGRRLAEPAAPGHLRHGGAGGGPGRLRR